MAEKQADDIIRVTGLGSRNSLRGSLPRAVFLDRDGVINKLVVRSGKAYAPRNLAELEIFPLVSEALQRLKAGGFAVIVVSNQPDVPRGIASRVDVETINAFLKRTLQIDEFRVCYHDDSDGCACRKPSPGMLLDAASERELDLKACFMVGDRWRDIEAGQRAGCKTLFVDHASDERRPEGYDYCVKTLWEAACIIVSD